METSHFSVLTAASFSLLCSSCCDLPCQFFPTHSQPGDGVLRQQVFHWFKTLFSMEWKFDTRSKVKVGCRVDLSEVPIENESQPFLVLVFSWSSPWYLSSILTDVFLQRHILIFPFTSPLVNCSITGRGPVWVILHCKWQLWPPLRSKWKNLHAVEIWYISFIDEKII